jgi:hypothetical protein
MLTELERKCLKGNATELRKIARTMGLLNMDELGYTREFSSEELFKIQDRLDWVVRNMKSLQTILNQPLTNTI